MKAKTLLLAGLVLSLMAASAMATVSTVAYYRLGENDGAVSAGNPAADPTVDASVNAMNLSRFNTPVYTGSVSADAAACTGSTLAMTFDGSSYYRGTGVWTSAVDNVGMECWAKTNSSGGYHSLVYNGNDSGGYGIYQAGNTFKGLAQGVAFFGGSDQGNVVEGEWVHLAMVISNGVGSIYVNGVLNGTPFSVAPAAPQGYTSLASAIKPSGGTDGDRFNGDLDEVRIFTFEPGQFSVSDLLIPEPATMSLLGVGMVGLLRRRSR